MYSDRISGGVDLVTYWFIKAWQAIANGRSKRAGLVATNSIRSGSNRNVLQRIVDQGSIFEAWEDEEWTVEGAAVRVSLICFTQERASTTKLNDQPVGTIYANLTARSFDVTKAVTLKANRNVSFVGVILNGDFEIPAAVARQWLLEPLNINGRPNADVLRPTFNGDDFNGVREENWS